MAEQLLAAQRRPRRVLDFGTGDGYFLGVILRTCAPDEVVGYEPDPQMFQELQARAFAPPERTKLHLTTSIAHESPGSFDTITCLEVLEHLAPTVRLDALHRFRELLGDRGTALISVPIEVGMASLFKNTARLLIGQPHDNTSARTVLRSLFGLSIARPGTPYIGSHIGFDYHALERDLRTAGFNVTRRQYSPLPLLGPFLNTQVFYVAVKGPADCS